MSNENSREMVLFRARALARAGFFRGDPIQATVDFALGEIRRAVEDERQACRARARACWDNPEMGPEALDRAINEAPK